jgi:hypothetical protein
MTRLSILIEYAYLLEFIMHNDLWWGTYTHSSRKYENPNNLSPAGKSYALRIHSRTD